MNLTHNYVYKWGIDPTNFSTSKVDYANSKIIQIGLKEGNEFNFASLNIQALLKKSDKRSLVGNRFRKIKNAVKAITHSQSAASDDFFPEIESSPEQDKLHALYFNTMKQVPIKAGQDSESGFALLTSPTAAARRRNFTEVPEFLKEAGPLALRINKIFENIDKSTQDHDSSTFMASSVKPYYQFPSFLEPNKAGKSESFTIDPKNLKPIVIPTKTANNHLKNNRYNTPQKRRDSIRNISVPKSFSLNKSAGNPTVSLPKIRK